jgi:hypothetical protein
MGDTAPPKQKVEYDTTYHLTKEASNESVNICSLYDSDPRQPKPCRAGRRGRAKARPQANLKPKAIINGEIISILLDSGSINRNFVTEECCNKLNMTKLKLTYPKK